MAAAAAAAAGSKGTRRNDCHTVRIVVENRRGGIGAAIVGLGPPGFAGIVARCEIQRWGGRTFPVIVVVVVIVPVVGSPRLVSLLLSVSFLFVVVVGFVVDSETNLVDLVLVL
jgi:hypothetical protein